MRLPLFPLSLAALTFATEFPSELFSDIIPAKVYATRNLLPPSDSSYPSQTTTSGNWTLSVADWWTSGFLPATFYALNERVNLCGSSKGLDITNWLEAGQSSTTGLVPLETTNTVGHDVGFLSYPYVDELKINPTNETAQEAVNKFATLLANRFVPVAGVTRSWDSVVNVVVIIDNMMNLDVLFASADLTGNQTLRDIAISHANVTMINHFREDGSTWHVVEYNSTTGAVVSKHTDQGYADNSTWSRGQSWAIYGYANMYNRTGDERYLNTSRKAATYFLDNLPSNGIVPWDFNAPVLDRPADSSAATIVTNGLLFLYQIETDANLAQQWLQGATTILNHITALAWSPSWQSLLSNGTVDWPANNSLTGIVYGDYYFIQAGNELVRLGLVSC